MKITIQPTEEATPYVEIILDNGNGFIGDNVEITTSTCTTEENDKKVSLGYFSISELIGALQGMEKHVDRKCKSLVQQQEMGDKEL